MRDVTHLIYRIQKFREEAQKQTQFASKALDRVMSMKDEKGVNLCASAWHDYVWNAKMNQRRAAEYAEIARLLLEGVLNHDK